MPDSASFTSFISYEDGDGELYTQYVDLPVDVVQAVETMSEEVETEKKGGFPFWILVLILLLLIAAGVAGYFFYKKKKAENEEETSENAEEEDSDWDEEDETDREGTETDSSEGDE